MSLPHFYLDDQVLSAEPGPDMTLRLEAGEVKHARALRLEPGEHIAVVDAARDYFECEVVSFDANGLAVRIAQRLEAPSRPSVVLVQGLAKGEKMDSVVRHATEVGVAGIVPVACERSVVRLDARKAASRVERWRSIAKNAAMQSGRADVPEVADLCSPAAAAELLAGATAVLVCWEEAPLSSTIAQALRAGLERSASPAVDARVAVVVGPEGGLTRAEVDAFRQANSRAAAVSLGPSILRTETAGVVAPALVLYELEVHA